MRNHSPRFSPHPYSSLLHYITPPPSPAGLPYEDQLTLRPRYALTRILVFMCLPQAPQLGHVPALQLVDFVVPGIVHA